MQISHKNLLGHISPTLLGKQSINQHLEMVLSLVKSLTSGFDEAQEYLVINFYCPFFIWTEFGNQVSFLELDTVGFCTCQ